jgi:acetoin utilization protein AcuB
MPLADIMSHNVITVGLDDELSTLRKLFDAHGFHHVLVVDGQRLVGVISDRDVLREMSPFIDTLGERTQDVATLRKKAHQFMSRKLVVARRDESVAEAVARMLDHSVSCLPVVTANGHVEGIVSWKDLIRALARSSGELPSRQAAGGEPLSRQGAKRE